MKNSREKIFAQIHASLHRDELNSAQKKILLERMHEHPRGILPQKAALSGEKLHELFIKQAEKVLTKVIKAASFVEVPKIILQILREAQLPLQLRSALNPQLKLLAWHPYPELIVKEGLPDQTDTATLTFAFCGVAETGTLVLLSNPESPTTLNFLTEINIVLLAIKDIVPYYEDAWDFICDQSMTPRVVNFITGPSRTADIERTVQIGIHGPKELYVILISETLY